MTLVGEGRPRLSRPLWRAHRLGLTAVGRVPPHQTGHMHVPFSKCPFWCSPGDKKGTLELSDFSPKHEGLTAVVRVPPCMPLVGEGRPRLSRPLWRAHRLGLTAVGRVPPHLLRGLTAVVRVPPCITLVGEGRPRLSRPLWRAHRLGSTAVGRVPPHLLTPGRPSS
jgi:hypothetical protein